MIASRKIHQVARSPQCCLLAITLTLFACGGGGGSGSSASIPVIESFRASPKTISAGESATVTWSVTGATTVSLAPDIGPVSGTSVVVIPTGTTTYTLSASNAAGSATSTTTVTVGAFVENDQAIGDPSINYNEIEISPDMRFMTWVEKPCPICDFGSFTAWLCALDPDTGLMRPENGRGYRIAGIREGGQPQWGTDASGIYSVAVDDTGRLLIVRPSLTASQTATASVTPLPTTPEIYRKSPYPSRITQDGGYIVYWQADRDDPPRPQLWWLDLAEPTVENQITTGPYAPIGRYGVPPFVVNVQRWFYDIAPNSGGLPIVTYGNATPNPGGNQPLTLEQLDFSTGQSVPSRVMGVSPQILDPFPFLYANERYVIGGIDAGPEGGVYREDENGQFSVEVMRLESSGSALVTPRRFESAEPFEYGGKAYTAYQLSEPETPEIITFGEIWFASVFDRTVSRRISGADRRHRVDPEFFIGTNSVWVLYQARGYAGESWQLRRADTGL